MESNLKYIHTHIKPPNKNNPGPDDVTSAFYKIFKYELISIFLNCFKEVEKEKLLPDSVRSILS